MIPRLHDRHYSRDLKAAITCSLSVTLFIFLFFPVIKHNHEKIIVTHELFSLQDIPVTRQPMQRQKIRINFPKIPDIKIADINEPPEKLHDVPIVTNQPKAVGSENKHYREVGNELVDQYTFTPRQIKEVLPQKTVDEVQGFVKISLLIGLDGKVVKYKIISNTTGNSQCLESVLVAVYNSRWQVAFINGQKVQYWVDKIYNFK